MQEQNGSLAEKLSQAEARLTEAQETSSSRAQTLAVELEQAKSRSNQIQVKCSIFFRKCFLLSHSPYCMALTAEVEAPIQACKRIVYYYQFDKFIACPSKVSASRQFTERQQTLF